MTTFAADTDLFKDRNRLAILENVNHFWIETVLKNTLYHRICDEFNKQRQPRGVSYFGNETARRTGLDNKHNETISLDAAFKRSDGKLLILGAPGTGKTTLLLQLTQTLLEMAVQDQYKLIPVVFHLSSYGNNQTARDKMWSSGEPLSLDDWLVLELTRKYYIPQRIAENWVQSDRLILLLDDLDRVALEHGSACVNAINTFMITHPSVKLAICSRTDIYDDFHPSLDINEQVVVHPFTIEQIDHWLTDLGPQLDGLWHVLDSDAVLLKLMQTPFLLDIAIWAYRGYDSSQIYTGLNSNSEQRQNILLEAYIERVIKENTTPDKHYSPQQTRRWLSWLARKMEPSPNNIFHIEMMQPSWLETNAEKRYYTIGFGVIFGSLLALVLDLVFRFWLGFESTPSGPALWISSLVLGMFLAHSVRKNDIELDEPLTFSPSKLVILLFISVLAGFGCGLLAVLSSTGLSNLLLLVFSIVMTIWSIRLKFSKPITKIVPNQDIWWSLFRPILAVLLFGISSWVFIRLTGWSDRILDALIWGPIAGFWESGGYRTGTSVFQHLALRILLYRNGVIPMNYARFLDYAASLQLLHKVGGGYLFTHRFLLEYFAAHH